MVDSKKLSEFSSEERQNLLLSVYEVFKKHGVEKKLNAPKVMDQLVTDLVTKKFDRYLHFVVGGQLKASDSELATQIKEEVNDLLKGISKDDREVEISAKIGVGDQIKPIENASVVFGEGKETIEHKEGQVILYDLWATWCPPCQAPMQHNQDMLSKNKDKWGDNVRIVGLSIDDSTATIKSHVENKKWTAIEHYHVDNGTCTASATYGSGGVPHVFLVDKSGKIVFMGHPSSRKLEEDIDNLLDGKTLTGEGTGPSDEPEAEGSKKTDPAEVLEAVHKFETAAKDLIQSE